MKEKYECLLCGRKKFDSPGPHKCVGGFRKRKLKWRKFWIDYGGNEYDELPEANIINT